MRLNCYCIVSKLCVCVGGGGGGEEGGKRYILEVNFEGFFTKGSWLAGSKMTI